MSNTHENDTPNIGHNGGPDFILAERVEKLAEATLDTALSRVLADDCNGTDLNAATKILKEIGGFEYISKALHQKAMAQNDTLDTADMDDFDEDGNILSINSTNLPPNSPSR